MKYIPLEFLKTVSLEKIPEKHPLRKALEGVVGREDRALVFIECDTDFLSPSYNGEFKELNDSIIACRYQMYKNMYPDSDKIIPGSARDKAAAGDCILPFLTAKTWEKHKQVYMFDPVLEETLSDVDEVKLPVRVLDRLPFREMYFDLHKDGEFAKKFHGAFIKVFPYKNGYCISVLRITENMGCMSGFLPLIPEKDDKDEEFLIRRDIDIESRETGKYADFKKFSMFMLNALLYLCSVNAEVRESEITKRTYRPGKTIKNKFSEVKIYECGYVYGSIVRKQKTKEKIEDPEKESLNKNVGRKTRNPYRAHVR